MALRGWEDIVRAVRAVDTATHPEYQGQGIFRRLTVTASMSWDRGRPRLQHAQRQEPARLPEDGWQRVGEVPIRVRVRRPVRFVRNLRSRRSPRASDGESLIAVAGPLAAWSEIAAAAERFSGDRFITPRDERYLRWRYDMAPLLGYRTLEERDADGLRGAVVYRVRWRGRLREATVVDLLVDPGDRGCASRLLRRVAREANADHLTCSFPGGSVQAAAARWTGFLPSPEGLTLVANPLHRLPLDPFTARSWWLTLGDLEVF